MFHSGAVAVKRGRLTSPMVVTPLPAVVNLFKLSDKHPELLGEIV